MPWARSLFLHTAYNCQKILTRHSILLVNELKNLNFDYAVAVSRSQYQVLVYLIMIQATCAKVGIIVVVDHLQDHQHCKFSK